MSSGSSEFLSRLDQSNGTREFEQFIGLGGPEIRFRSASRDALVLSSLLRALTRRIVTEDLPLGLASELANLMDRYGVDIDALPPTRFITPGGLAPEEPWTYPMASHPLIGSASPLAPPMIITREGSRVIGEVIFDCATEGWPGAVFGGYLAAGVDVVTGFASALSESPGVTKSLEVRFLKPARPNTLIRFEAEPGEASGVFSVTVSDNRGIIANGSATVLPREIRPGA